MGGRDGHALTRAVLGNYARRVSAGEPEGKDSSSERSAKADAIGAQGSDPEAGAPGQTEQAKKLGGLRDLSSAEVQKKLTDDKIKELIAKGVKEKKGAIDAEMPAFPDLQPATVDGLVKLVRGFAGK